MLRTRIVAVLLTVAVICCALVFPASAADEACEISVSFVGSGSVTVDGTDRFDDFTVYVDPGETVTMTAVPDPDFEFLFWVNRETNRIVSWNATYSFTAATYALYDAVFDVTESVAAEDDLHTVVYLTDGGNIIYMQPALLDDTSYIDEVPTSGMFISGKSWLGWDKTEQEVSETPGRVFVRPIYSTELSFTVTAVLNGETTTYEKKYLSTMTLSAPDWQNGEKFSYWIARAKDVNSVDEIASFYTTYQFIVTGDVTLEAVYGESYDLGVSARISGDFPSFNESAITISAEHSVTRNYTVTQHGMLITKDMQIGSFPDTFVIPQTSQPKIYKLTANDTTLAGSYRVPITNWTAETMGSYTAYPRIYARAYVIAKDKTTGVSYTFYSAIYCVDYVFETGSGGGDNNEDPFGH